MWALEAALTCTLNCDASDWSAVTLGGGGASVSAQGWRDRGSVGLCGASPVSLLFHLNTSVGAHTSLVHITWICPAPGPPGQGPPALPQEDGAYPHQAQSPRKYSVNERREYMCVRVFVCMCACSCMLMRNGSQRANSGVFLDGPPFNF